MVDYSDYNPAGTTRTTKRGIARHIPLLPNYFNHQWFEDYVTDFIQTNILENNGVISGCVITQDGGNDAINTSGGAVYVNGSSVNVAASGPYSLTADGWYVSYVTSAGAIIHGYLENSTVQGAVTPADSVIIGYTLLGNSVLYINSFFNDVSEFANQLIIKFDQKIGTSAQVTTGDATVYYDSATTSFKDKDGNVVVFNNGDRIKWIGLDTLTADIDLSAIDYLDWSMDTGLIIALGSYNLDLGENQKGEFNYSVTTGVVSIQSGNISLNNSDGFSDFSSKNLIINVQSNTEVDADADNIIFIDDDGRGIRVNGIDETFDMTTDRSEGTNPITELPSTWYQMWLDSLGIKKLAPDLVSVADSDVLNSLSDSAAEFQTYLVQPGDVLYNLDDLTQGFVGTVSTENVLTCVDKDGAALDLFPNGDENYKIRMLSPPGLGKFKARIGAAYNNSGSNLENGEPTGSGDVFSVIEEITTVNITSGGIRELGQILLTPGDWDITIGIYFNGAAGNTSEEIYWSDTSAAAHSSSVNGKNEFIWQGNSNTQQSFTFNVREKLSSQAKRFLNINLAVTNIHFSYIKARRLK